MDNLEIITMKKLIDENGSKILSVMSKRIRGNKEVIKYACKKDPIAVIYATEEIKQDSVFMLEAVGYDCDTFARLYRRFPEMRTPRADTIICLSNMPLGFRDIPYADFADEKYIKCCKHAVKFAIDRKLNHRKEKGISTTLSDVEWAESLLETITETEKQAKLYLAGQREQQKTSLNAKMKEISKSITKI